MPSGLGQWMPCFFADDSDFGGDVIPEAPEGRTHKGGSGNAASCSECFSTRTGEDVHTCGHRPRLVISRAEESGYSGNLMRAHNTRAFLVLIYPSDGRSVSAGRCPGKSAKLESGLPWWFQWLRIHLLGTRVCTPVHKDPPYMLQGS